jgi:RNA polymerase sigma factor for flagellar operon FliA
VSRTTPPAKPEKTTRASATSAEKDGPEVSARVRQGLDLVPKVGAQLLRHAKRARLPLEELSSYGNEGLLAAARTFDEARGVPFRAWAVIKIRGAILDGIRATSTVPRRVVRELRALEAADDVMEVRLEEDAPRPCEGAEAADARLNAYLAEMATAMAMTLLSHDAHGEDEHLTPEERASRAEVSGAVRAAVGRLPESEKRLVERHYFGDATLEEAARSLGLSKSWGSRLHARAIEALTREMKRNRISE